MFAFSFLPYRVEFAASWTKTGSTSFVRIIFSYLDILTMGLNPVNTLFVGKNDMEKIPLLRFHVPQASHHRRSFEVKEPLRNNGEDHAQALDEGKSLVIYPEGGIISTTPPNLASFKDGAFRAAIENKLPIVPVTIPHNWIILPDGDFVLNPGLITVIFHEPIEITGYTLDDIGKVKDMVREVITTELARQNSPAVVMA